MIKSIASKFYGLWFYVVFITAFLLLYPIFAILLSKEKWHPAANKVRRFWAALVFIGIGSPWRVTYETAIDTKASYVFTPNHSSNLDIPLFALSWAGHYRFMAKKQWADVPVFGIFFRTIDIPVDRDKKMSAYRALLKAEEALKNGDSMVVFPEGTMSADGPFTTPFKTGPFKMAIRTGVPIVPITFLDNWRLYPRTGKRGGRPGFARVIVHKPISVKGLTEADEDLLKTQVQEIIDGALKAEWGDWQDKRTTNTSAFA